MLPRRPPAAIGGDPQAAGAASPLASAAGAASRAIEAFAAAAEGLSGSWSAAPIALCLSGGGDSSALAFAAACAAIRTPTLRGRLVACHALHALRGEESDGDRDAVRALCARLDLPLREVEAPVPAGSGGIEARARAARYGALRRCFGPRVLLATAHHADDQAETVALRLLRGAGPAGLRGIQALRADGVWRPLLGLGRADLAAALREWGHAPRHDSSNDDLRLARNWVRHRLLPDWERREPGVRKALLAVARSAEGLAPRLAARQDALGDELELTCDALGLRIATRSLAALAERGGLEEVELLLARRFHEAGRRAVSREQLGILLRQATIRPWGYRGLTRSEAAFWSDGQLRFVWNAAERRPRAATGAAAARVLLAPDRDDPGCYFPIPGRGELAGVAAITAELGSWNASETGWPEGRSDEAWMDADAIEGGPLCLRRPREGDFFAPLGRGEDARSLAGFLKKQGLSLPERIRTPVVARGSEILWIPGLRISERTRIHAGTRRRVELRIEWLKTTTTSAA